MKKDEYSPLAGWLALPAASAVCLMLFGVVILVWPAKALELLPVALGIGLLLAGGVQLAFFWAQRTLGSLPGFGWLAGTVTLMVGLVFLLNRNVSIAFLGICGGTWAMVLGILRMRAALQKRRLELPWKTHLAGSLVYIAAGALLLFSPFWGMEQAARLLGLVLIGAGAGLLYGCWGARRLLDRLGNTEVHAADGDSNGEDT